MVLQVKVKEVTVWGTTSMVLGILSLVLFLMPYFGLPLGIMALVFSSKQKKIKPTGRATTGLVCGIIGIVINSIMILGMLFVLALFPTLVGI